MTCDGTGTGYLFCLHLFTTMGYELWLYEAITGYAMSITYEYLMREQVPSSSLINAVSCGCLAEMRVVTY